MNIIGRIAWQGPGWYASRVEQDSGQEAVLPLESRSDSKSVPSQAQSLEAYQKGLGSPFYLESPPEGFQVY